MKIFINRSSDTMKCPKCGSFNQENAKFCKGCGSPLETQTAEPATDKSKIIIAGLVGVIIIIIVVGAIFAGGFFKSETPQQSETPNQTVEHTSPSAENTQTTEHISSDPQPATRSISILGGSFSTGSAESDKTYAHINVGRSHAGESYIVQIYYSRDGSRLNNGNMVPVSVHSDGYIEVASADAYHYYPDKAVINIYDTNNHLLTTKTVYLSPRAGTQTF